MTQKRLISFFIKLHSFKKTYIYFLIETIYFFYSQRGNSDVRKYKKSKFRYNYKKTCKGNRLALPTLSLDYKSSDSRFPLCSYLKTKQKKEQKVIVSLSLVIRTFKSLVNLVK